MQLQEKINQLSKSRLNHLKNVENFKKSFNEVLTALPVQDNPTLISNSATRFLSIKVTSNNIFGVLTDMSTNQRRSFFVSAGCYKMNSSKKRQRFVLKQFLFFFLKDIRQKVGLRGLIVKISAARRVRLLALFPLVKLLKRRNVLLSFSAKKCFNGCRPAKKRRRKKKKNFRLTKLL